MRLFGYWRSSSAWRVRIALHHKGVAFDNVPVHLVREGGEQHADDHRARNPMRQVPVLQIEDDGEPVYLSQSLAILLWLEATHPEPALLPADPVAKARAWQLAELINSGIQPLQNLKVLLALEAHGVDKVAWARDQIASGFDALEATAEQLAGTFLVGDEVTVADCCLVPQLYNARRFGVDLAPYPTLTRVEAACAALPSFQAAHPDAQPDAPTT